MNFLTKFFADKKEPETLEEQVIAIGVVDENAPVNGAAVIDGNKEEEKLRSLFPKGFFKLVRDDGTLLEVRFWCPDCKLLVTPAGPEVKHCGRTDFRPENFLQTLFMKKTGVRWI